jgi:hypothetical protein
VSQCSTNCAYYARNDFHTKKVVIVIVAVTNCTRVELKCEMTVLYGEGASPP